MEDPYAHELTAVEIAKGSHRGAVGGRWEEMGRLQLDFLVKQGLRPSDELLDVGCGALRAGLHFIRYLKPGNYFALNAIPHGSRPAGSARPGQVGRPSSATADQPGIRLHALR